MKLPALARDTLVVSLAYLLAIFATFEVVIPVQDIFFPVFASHASLLFLPSGVRVLSAWLLGWRSVVALAPGVFLAFFYVAGIRALEPSRIFAILIAITVPAATFHAFQLLRWNIAPQPDQRPCWPCVMGAGIVISILSSVLTNYALGSPSNDYLAYFIGDFFGLLFLMMGLMFAFRAMRRRGL
ncbi:MAG: hypothetical protein HRU33_11600 [Rhodobacteraceae bacterium]|nr:hypothetical protein [Paracoccaceae bacterium]